MSDPASRLQPGEHILFQIDRGRNWYHYLLLILPYLLLGPLLLWMVANVLLPILGDLLPGPAGILIAGTFVLIVLAGMVVDMIQFETNYLAFTEKRLIGRVQGTNTAWTTRPIDLPLEAVDSAVAVPGFLYPAIEIRLKDRRSAVLVRGLRRQKQFAEKLNAVLIHRS